ncbi:hypothetical protein KV699_08530 [Vreelandella titanicae]|uniref:hypothetical protein n=1 Tax=Vreelandella titanicae TaxID=664683 RepID=UPI003BAFE607
MIKTNFFTCANAKYEFFIPIYTFFVLRNNPDALVEIVVEDLAAIERLEPLRAKICDYFGSRFHIRTGDFNNKTPNIVRFVEVPEISAKYTYIADIDILIVEDVTVWHEKKMKELNLPHSNIIRKNSHRLTGLHFCLTEQHYPLNFNVHDIYAKPSSTDEVFLYKTYESKGLLPPPGHQSRPEHGIHVSLNRCPYDKKGWGMNPIFFEKTIDTINEIENSFVYSYFNKKSRWILNIIKLFVEAECIFDEKELDGIRFLSRSKNEQRILNEFYLERKK